MDPAMVFIKDSILWVKIYAAWQSLIEKYLTNSSKVTPNRFTVKNRLSISFVLKQSYEKILNNSFNLG